MAKAPLILFTRAGEPGWAERVRAIAPGARLFDEKELEDDPGLIGRVEICYPGLKPELWDKAARLRWVQADYAGVDTFVDRPEVRRHPAVLTNVHIHGQSIAEHLWGMTLALTRNLHKAAAEQAKGSWKASLREGLSSLAGHTLCVAGLGIVGTRCAEIGRAFGMSVIGISRHARPNRAADEVVGSAERARAFARSRVIMLILPNTPDTVGFVGKPELDATQGAFLLNAGRGPSVVTDELVAALRDGRVRGAGLDVTDPEPLPGGHPLWAAPNVIITPHYAGNHPGYAAEAFEVFCRNLERWMRDEPLECVVDRAAGY